MGVLSTRTCALCGSPGATALFTSTHHPIIELTQPFTYYACHRCGVHFLDTESLPDDLYLVEKEATREDAPDERHYVHWDDDVARALASRVPPAGPWPERPARLLDFGSGYGDMLIAAKRAGYQPEGLDVSPVFASRAEERSGCPVFVGPVHEAAYPSNAFAVINAHFALEYVRDLRETVRELARILSPGGVLRVCSYTTDSVPAKIKRAGWWNYTPTRPFLFSRQTMDFLADESGLRVTEVIHGGEKSFGHYLEERPEGARAPLRTAVDWARYHLQHVHVGAMGLGSCRAFYLAKA